MAESRLPSGSEAGERLPVPKTYKLFIGGAFPRSESGRSYVLTSPAGEFLANPAQASRKDVRDAVVAARKAQPGWAAATAYNRGQVLYRVAEIMEERSAQFVQQVMISDGVDQATARSVVGEAVDRWVWFAGWADKLAQVAGSSNPVAGPYFNFTVPEPTGVVAVIAPQESSLLGLVGVIAPAIVSGNTVVVVAAHERPLPAISLAEVLATSDVPGGVVNILTGVTAELAPVLASHMDVNAIDLAGAGELSPELERAAANNVKRVVRADGIEWSAAPSPDRMFALVEAKTVWHPVGI